MPTSISFEFVHEDRYFFFAKNSWFLLSTLSTTVTMAAISLGRLIHCLSSWTCLVISSSQCFSLPVKEIRHFPPPIMRHIAQIWYWECRKTIGKKIGLKRFVKNAFFGGLKVVVFQKHEIFYMYLCNIITWLLSIKNTKIWGVLKSTFHDLHFETL